MNYIEITKYIAVVVSMCMAIIAALKLQKLSGADAEIKKYALINILYWALFSTLVLTRITVFVTFG